MSAGICRHANVAATDSSPLDQDFGRVGHNDLSPGDVSAQGAHHLPSLVLPEDRDHVVLEIRHEPQGGEVGLLLRVAEFLDAVTGPQLAMRRRGRGGGTDRTDGFVRVRLPIGLQDEIEKRRVRPSTSSWDDAHQRRQPYALRCSRCSWPASQSPGHVRPWPSCRGDRHRSCGCRRTSRGWAWVAEGGWSRQSRRSAPQRCRPRGHGPGRRG
jgi:hypothetical protein